MSPSPPSPGAPAGQPPEDEVTRFLKALPQQPVEEKFVLSLPGGARQEFCITKASVVIGRATANDIVLADTSVSRRHARVESSAEGYEIIDLGSVNGITVNGVRVARAWLKPGDVFGIGDSAFRFVTGNENNADMTRVKHMREIEMEAIQDAPLSMNIAETALPRVVVVTPSRTWDVPMTGDALTVGRAAGNDVVIDAESVSRQHAVIERHGSKFRIRDLNSANGTWLREQRVQTADIDDGAALRVGGTRLLFKRGFAADDLAISERIPRARRPVVVIPGFGGSELWRGSEKIWPSRRALTNTEVMLPTMALEARGLVDEVVVIPNLIKQDQYSLLTGYLKENLDYESGRDLLEFAYDFRQDNRESARQLAAAIDAWDVREPVTIICHSMGSLIARYFVECLGGRTKVERVIYLGGPHSGTPYAFTSLVTGPNLLPLGMMNSRLRDLLATFPSWYQILPTYPFAIDQRSGFDVLLDESWLAEAQRPLLRAARRFRAELGNRASVPSVCVFGYDIKTVTGVTVEREEHGYCRKANFAVTRQGDGMIPESSGLLEGAEIHPVRQHHGALYSDSDVKMRLKLELTKAR